MFQTNLINTVLVWERILEIEEEKRRLTRFEDVFTEETGWVKPETVKRNGNFSLFTAGKVSNPCCSPAEPCNEIPAR